MLDACRAVAWAACLVATSGMAMAAENPLCRPPYFGLGQFTICNDRQLAKLNDQAVSKVDALLPRSPYGQYLGLRYWQNRGMEERERCASNKTCLRAHLQGQHRFLDRLRRCLDSGANRRTCWRTAIGGAIALPR